MQIDDRKKEYFIKLYDKSKSWPDSFEKCLVTSLYYVKSVEDLKNVDDVLSNECDIMVKRLKIEGLETEEYKKRIECLRINFKNKKWKCAEKELEEMLKELRTLDINKIEELRDEINKAHAELKGKDVVLFLGPTGSGKSTTVHFLAGSKMEKREKYGIKHHIEPVENKNNPTLLSRIKTSPLSQSETQFITTTEILLKII